MSSEAVLAQYNNTEMLTSKIPFLMRGEIRFCVPIAKLHGVGIDVQRGARTWGIKSDCQLDLEVSDYESIRNQVSVGVVKV